jgi:hypothetical protein
MKKTALLLCTLMVVAGAAFAMQATTAPATQAAPAMDTAKTHVVEAEIVSADTTAKTLTLKGDPENKTVKVEGAAAENLKDLKAGEKVKLTCRDNAKGEHQAVTHITVEKAAAVKNPTK